MRYFVALLLAIAIAYPYLITNCQSINTSGYYELSNDINFTSGTCISINVSNVTLDCKNHLISGTNASLAGIYVYGAKNVSIFNCGIKNVFNQSKWGYGLYVKNSENINITNASLSNNSLGLYVYNSSNVKIDNTKILSEKSLYGAYLIYTHNITLSSIDISGSASQLLLISRSKNVSGINISTEGLDNVSWYYSYAPASYGIKIDTVDNFKAKNIFVNNTYIGLGIQYSNATLSNIKAIANYYRFSSAGFSISYSNAEARNISIINYRTGIKVLRSNASIENATVIGSMYSSIGSFYSNLTLNDYKNVGSAYGINLYYPVFTKLDNIWIENSSRCFVYHDYTKRPSTVPFITKINNTYCDGKEVVFYQNLTNKTIDLSNISTFVCYACKNLLLKNADVKLQYSAVVLIDGKNITITNSTTDNVPFAFIFFNSTNILFKNNVIKSFYDAAIYATNISNTTIANNYFERIFAGIEIIDSHNVSIENNTFNNSMANELINNLSCISLKNSQNIKVIKNTFLDVSQYGFDDGNNVWEKNTIFYETTLTHLNITKINNHTFSLNLSFEYPNHTLCPLSNISLNIPFLNITLKNGSNILGNITIGDGWYIFNITAFCKTNKIIIPVFVENGGQKKNATFYLLAGHPSNPFAGMPWDGQEVHYGGINGLVMRRQVLWKGISQSSNMQASLGESLETPAIITKVSAHFLYGSLGNGTLGIDKNCRYVYLYRDCDICNNFSAGTSFTYANVSKDVYWRIGRPWEWKRICVKAFTKTNQLMLWSSSPAKPSFLYLEYLIPDRMYKPKLHLFGNVSEIRCSEGDNWEKIEVDGNGKVKMVINVPQPRNGIYKVYMDGRECSGNCSYKYTNGNIEINATLGSWHEFLIKFLPKQESPASGPAFIPHPHIKIDVLNHCAEHFKIICKISNSPASNVSIFVNGTEMGKTNASGLLTLSLPPGTYEIRARKNGAVGAILVTLKQCQTQTPKEEENKTAERPKEGKENIEKVAVSSFNMLDTLIIFLTIILIVLIIYIFKKSSRL